MPDTIAQRTLACTGCHGREGRATSAGYFPRIAGKPAGYLHEQLLNFRDGRRRHAAMSGLLAPLSDAYLREIAEYFAELDLPYPPPQTRGAARQLLERGESLVRRGDAKLEVPACADCHGERLTGVSPGIPGLLGLPRDYLNAQFGAWREGQRHATAPDCMAQIASRLSPPDVQALSTWLSSQPVPADSRPAPASAKALPMRCGPAVVRGTPAVSAAAAPSDPQVARGRYLALAGNCAGCHTAPGDLPYAGGKGVPTPFGTVMPGNLTPDVSTGLGAWSADDFWRAMHEGRSRDGRMLYPAFPYLDYTRITRQDSDALFAWLRSLPPVARENPTHRLRFPYDTQAALGAWRALYFRPDSFRPDPARSEAWNRGAYLVQGLGHCGTCHSPRNTLGATRSAAELGGGLIPVLGWYAPSLAAPAQAGLADWPLEEVVQLLGTGAAPRATTSGPMAEVVHRSLQHLLATDLEAMTVYLKSLGQGEVASPAAASRKPGAALASDPQGAALYERHCADCHGDSGQGRRAGGRPAWPALAGNRAVIMEPPVNAVRMVLAGGFAPATRGNPRPWGMPPFGHLLDDAEVAAVLSYIRNSWGNAAAPVTPLQVRQWREGKGR
ncbi:c-type cytochrome [Quisquiliibacterium transsilvanicum]|uniref:Cytochrome c553 n=1 Tax=Quisquiliibacterium transsilvanicum TaxID=1549638 RepID=A0A7W8HEK0_9BURK|nr:cytochrome c553 [Quisquiliibacterium transsilvanicum]